MSFNDWVGFVLMVALGLPVVVFLWAGAVSMVVQVYDRHFWRPKP